MANVVDYNNKVEYINHMNKVWKTLVLFNIAAWGYISINAVHHYMVNNSLMTLTLAGLSAVIVAMNFKNIKDDV